MKSKVLRDKILVSSYGHCKSFLMWGRASWKTVTAVWFLLFSLAVTREESNPGAQLCWWLLWRGGPVGLESHMPASMGSSFIAQHSFPLQGTTSSLLRGTASYAPWLCHRHYTTEQECSGQRASLSEITTKLLHLAPYKAIVHTSSYALPRTFFLTWVVFWVCAVEDCLLNVFVYIHRTRVVMCYIWLNGKKSLTGTLSSSAGCKQRACGLELDDL